MVLAEASAAAARPAAILDAALAVFSERGVAAATIEEIRVRSGASVGSIYHHFGSKEGIAAALYVEGLRDYQAGALAALRGRDGRAGIRALVRHHVGWVVANPPLAAYLLESREPAVERAAREDLAAINRAFFDEVARWRSGAGVRALPLDLFHAVVLGPAQEWARHWLAGRAETTPARAERVLADAAWAAISKEKP